MWLFTKIGFYSVVQHRENDQVVIIRARDRADLVALQGLMHEMFRRERPPKVASTPAADYPYRMNVGKARFAEVARRFAEDVDYENFKDRVKRAQGNARAALYLRVWAAMREDMP